MIMTFSARELGQSRRQYEEMRWGGNESVTSSSGKPCGCRM